MSFHAHTHTQYSRWDEMRFTGWIMVGIYRMMHRDKMLKKKNHHNNAAFYGTRLKDIRSNSQFPPSVLLERFQRSRDDKVCSESIHEGFQIMSGQRLQKVGCTCSTYQEILIHIDQREFADTRYIDAYRFTDEIKKNHSIGRSCRNETFFLSCDGMPRQGSGQKVATKSIWLTSCSN